MKTLYRFYIILWLLSPAYSYCQTGWFWINPHPQGNYLFDVKFANNLTGWIVGNAGTVLKTTDRGCNWSWQRTYIEDDFRTLSVADADNVFAVGSNGAFMKTTNGGIKWIQMNTETNAFITASDFINLNTGWIGTSNGKVFRTTNSGYNWTDVSLPDSTSIISMAFINSNTGFLLGSNSYSKKTTNGGLNWLSIPAFPSSSLYVNITFVNQDTGYLTLKKTISMSTNGGINWIDKYSNSSNNINAISFFNSRSCLAIYSFSFFPLWGYSTLFTNNAFVSFTEHSVPLRTDVKSVVHFDTTSGIYLTGSANICLTTNSGIQYTSLINGSTDNISYSGFTSADTGYFCAGKMIYKTTDGGAQFYPLKTLVRNITTGAIPIKNVIYVFSDSLFLKSTNGGSYWSQYQNIFSGIDNCSFTDVYNGWGVGPGLSGRVIKTTNGGVNWSVYLTGTNKTHTSVCFVNSLTGYITVTASKYMYKTTNGGVNWSQKNTGIYQNNTLYSSYFLNANTGWMAGYELIRTTDGGENWTQQYLSDNIIKAINFTDVNTGWAVGEAGSILYTTNSGLNWSKQLRITNMNLSKISVINKNIVYVSGDEGVFLKTLTGGNVGVINNETALPESINLLFNYPNPFNSITNLKYQVSKFGNVKIIIHDISGKQIKIINRGKESPGVYNVKFDSGGLSSGVYFYSLVVDGLRIDTKKMVLLK